MAENTKIEWATHTFNPWSGCTKVSTGCQFCYAETLSERYPALGEWGPQGTRKITGDAYWKQPLKWNREAEKAGTRPRVFCASLSDVFEDNPQVLAARHRLFELIDATPYLDWLLLTKRPENIERLWPFGWYDDQFSWPNVWLGTSVENQETADQRIPHLLQVPAKVRFLSCEPLLGPVDLMPYLKDCESCEGEGEVFANFDPRGNPVDCLPASFVRDEYGHNTPDDGRFIECPDCVGRIDWVICGGESGPNARPMHPMWARSIRDQCIEANVPFLFKQWGEYKPFAATEDKPDGGGAKERTDWHNWNGGVVSVKVGKKAAGRLLDGRTWDEFPETRTKNHGGFNVKR